MGWCAPDRNIAAAHYKSRMQGHSGMVNSKTTSASCEILSKCAWMFLGAHSLNTTAAPTCAWTWTVPAHVANFWTQPCSPPPKNICIPCGPTCTVFSSWMDVSKIASARNRLRQIQCMGRAQGITPVEDLLSKNPRMQRWAKIATDGKAISVQ